MSHHPKLIAISYITHKINYNNNNNNNHITEKYLSSLSFNHSHNTLEKPSLIQSAHIKGSAIQIVTTKQIIHYDIELRDQSRT